MSYSGRVLRLLEKTKKLTNEVKIIFISDVNELTKEMLEDPAIIYLYMEL